MSRKLNSRKIELALVTPPPIFEGEGDRKSFSFQNDRGDHCHQLSQSESGVELKSLLKLIDNVIEKAPATDEDDPLVLIEITEEDEEEKKKNPFLESTRVYSHRQNKRNNHSNTSKSNSEEGKVTVSETLMVPVKKYPKYNFVGRILGPRGMTVKQLEKETGCKIFVRGRASSSAFNPHTKTKQTTPFNPRSSLSTISQSALTEDPLHVFIECHDYPESGPKKLAEAVAIIKDLLSPPADGKDELKRQQLVDISLINGTYRATNNSSSDENQISRRWGQSVDPTSSPVDFELKPLRKEFGGTGPSNSDLGSVYGITQRRRVWQKPRGPDTSSEEYAKSVSSREFVSDFVSHTKKSPTKSSGEESMYQLPQSVVSETLKVAKNLLDSHESMSFAFNSPDLEKKVPKPPTLYRKSMGAGDAPSVHSVQSAQSVHTMPTMQNDFSMPPPLMQSVPFRSSFPSEFYPPPPPPLTSQYPDYLNGGMLYMFPPHPPPMPPHFTHHY